jgi:hypothetical protein
MSGIMAWRVIHFVPGRLAAAAPVTLAELCRTDSMSARMYLQHCQVVDMVR